MDHRLVVLCLSSVLGLAVSSLPFTIQELGNDAFEVKIGPLLVFHHDKGSPMAFVGQGKTSITETSGIFTIDDYVSARIPLQKFETNCTSSNCVIRLGNGDSYIVLVLGQEKDQDLSLSIMESSDDFDRIWLRIVAEADEEAYGVGEQYSYYNLRHRDRNGENVFPIWVGEQGVGRNASELSDFLSNQRERGAGGDYHTTYFPQPTYVSSRNFYVHHDGSNYGVFDFGHETFNEMMILGTMGTFYINKEDSQAALVSTLNTLLGKMPELPAWIQEGVVLGVQGGTNTLLEKYNLAKKNDIPVGAMWIQDWSGKRDTGFGQRVEWNWEYQPKWYPGLQDIIKNMSAESVRIFGYINPYLASDGSLFQEAKQNGYLVKNKEGQVYLQRSISVFFGSVDFTNPAAWQWYKDDVIKGNMIDLGLGGWMADFGEYLPTDAVLHDGRSGLDVHNEWPTLWAKLNREAVEESGKLGEIVFFTRSGFTGVSNYTLLHWNGDQNVDFELADGVRSTIYGSLGMGLNGVTLSHFDIGGYTTSKMAGFVRTEELFLRSAEYAIFTPVFRTHEGNEITSNVQWYSPQSIVAFTALAKKFSLLADYRKHVVSEAASKGLPAMRPISLVFEGSSSPPDQYMFGSDVLVAPVYEKNVTQRPVTFPPLDGDTKWIHIWSGRQYDPSKTIPDCQAPLGEPPVFYRSDSAFKESVFQKLLNDKDHGEDHGEDSDKDKGDPDSALLISAKLNFILLLCSLAIYLSKF